MALPDGITTCTVTAGVPVTHTGGPVKAFVSIEPSVFLVHTATGTPLVDFLEELSINEGVAGQFTLPHTDQAGFQDENGNAYTNWYYTARISYSTVSKAKTKAPKIKVFQLATGQTLVDLDQLPGGAPALPYTAPIATVTSFGGRTGPVTLQEGDLPPRLSEASLSAAIVDAQPFLTVDSYKQATDPDDTASWQRAITAAIAQGVRRVVARKAAYTLSARVNCGGAAGLTVEGLGRGVTVLNFASPTSTPIASGFYASSSASDLTFRDFTIRGTIVDDVTAPRRARTETATGLESGFIFHGDLNPGNGSSAVIRNVTLERVGIEKTSGLPFQFDGVRGYAKAFDVETYLTMDGGWVFCEHAVYDRLRSIKSADNGFSISRGNQKVTGGSIYAEMCAYYGAWFAGFYVNGTGVETGPDNFTVESIHVVDAGMGGVNLDNAPTNGKIGSIFVKGVRRGPVDGPTDAGGLGVIIGGYPSTNRSAVTAYAENIVLDNVDVIDCARGGVHLTAGCRNIKVGNFTGLNIGSQFAANGTTAISSGDTENNYGVGIPAAYPTTVTGVTLDSVTFIDNRATPYANFAVAAPDNVSNLVVKNNLTRGARQGVASSRKAVVTAGAQASTATAAGNGAFRDRGTVNATAGASPAAGTLITVGFTASPYSSTPNVVLTAANLASAQCQPYLTNRSSTGFSIACAVAPGAAASLSFDYHITG